MDGDVTITVPAQHASAVYELLSELTKTDGQGPTPPVAGRPAWSSQLVKEARQQLGDQERELALRVAESRGRRLPLSRLASDLGLPDAAAAEHDFPGLTAYCAPADRPAMPVESGGSGDDAWYWMAPAHAALFQALAQSAGT